MGSFQVKAVYVAHPLRGATGSPEEIRTNLERIDEIMKNFAAIYPNNLFISPLHAFSYYDARGPQKQVMRQCLAALDLCQEIWVCGEWRTSEGCKMELSYADSVGIPIVYMKV